MCMLNNKTTCNKSIMNTLENSNKNIYLEISTLEYFNKNEYIRKL